MNTTHRAASRAKRQYLTAERLREVLNYDPETGEFIWIVCNSKRAPTGSIAGSINSQGYRCISIDNIDYRANRLAWLYVTGVMPTGDIDHIDGNPANDSLSNLRDVTHSINLQNQLRPTANNKSTRVLGVHKHGRMYRAQLKVDGKTLRVGSFTTIEAASAAYLVAKRQLHEGCTI